MITIFQACSSGDTFAVLRSTRFLRSNGFGTLLHTACLHGRTQVVRMLISAGASVDALDGDGMRPIHRACQGGSLETIDALLELGADEKDVDWNETT